MILGKHAGECYDNDVIYWKGIDNLLVGMCFFFFSGFMSK